MLEVEEECDIGEGDTLSSLTAEYSYALKLLEKYMHLIWGLGNCKVWAGNNLVVSKGKSRRTNVRDTASACLWCVTASMLIQNNGCKCKSGALVKMCLCI